MPKFWITNGVLFQAAWFTAALLTDYSVAIIGVIIFLHFCLSDNPSADAKLLLLAPIGWIADYTLINYQIFADTDGGFPIWLALIWCMFIMSLNHSLGWLNKINLALASLIGAVGGASSYAAAIRFDVLQTTLPWTEFLLTVGLTWAILTPTLLVLGQKIVLIKNTSSQT
jgi:hypothetical protein